MDSERLGRVLGRGARLAGKTLVEAVDAATSPDPRENGAKVEVISPGRAVQRAKVTSKNVARGGKKFGEAVWGPMARASGVLWLEVTGLFFGLVMVTGLQGMWLHRSGAMRGGSVDEVRHFWMATALGVVFGYFCVSSFVRARRKSRGKA